MGQSLDILGRPVGRGGVGGLRVPILVYEPASLARHWPNHRRIKYCMLVADRRAHWIWPDDPRRPDLSRTSIYEMSTGRRTHEMSPLSMRNLFPHWLGFLCEWSGSSNDWLPSLSKHLGCCSPVPLGVPKQVQHQPNSGGGFVELPALLRSHQKQVER